MKASSDIRKGDLLPITKGTSTSFVAFPPHGKEFSDFPNTPDLSLWLSTLMEDVTSQTMSILRFSFLYNPDGLVMLSPPLGSLGS